MSAPAILHALGWIAILAWIVVTYRVLSTRARHGAAILTATGTAAAVLAYAAFRLGDLIEDGPATVNADAGTLIVVVVTILSVAAAAAIFRRSHIVEQASTKE